MDIPIEKTLIIIAGIVLVVALFFGIQPYLQTKGTLIVHAERTSVHTYTNSYRAIVTVDVENRMDTPLKLQAVKLKTITKDGQVITWTLATPTTRYVKTDVYVENTEFNGPLPENVALVNPGSKQHITITIQGWLRGNTAWAYAVVMLTYKTPDGEQITFLSNEIPILAER